MKLHIATSPLTNNIYVGRVNKVGNAFLEGKQDVTGASLAAVAEHVIRNSAPVVVSADGVPKYEITAREIAAAS